MSPRHAHRAFVSALLVSVTVVSCTGADHSDSGVDSGRVAGEYTCLVPPPLQGVRLGDSVASFRAALGEPLASLRSVEHRGGQRVEVVTYRYPRADVHVVRGRVDRIVSTAAGGWPRGLAVGSARQEVDQYTGQHRLLRVTSGDTIEISVCPEHRALLHLAPFAGQRRVRRVELISRSG
jgi:hypothetical protein